MENATQKQMNELFYEILVRSDVRAGKAQTSLRIRAVSSEPSLHALTMK